MTTEEAQEIMGEIVKRHDLVFPEHPWRTSAEQLAFLQKLSPTQIEKWVEALEELHAEYGLRMKAGESAHCSPGWMVSRTEQGEVIFERVQ